MPACRRGKPRWTDERLDDLNKRVDEGFSEALQRLMMQMFASMMIGFLGIIATILAPG